MYKRFPARVVFQIFPLILQRFTALLNREREKIDFSIDSIEYKSNMATRILFSLFNFFLIRPQPSFVENKSGSEAEEAVQLPPEPAL